MKNIEIILNAVLKKNIIDYILVDKDLCVVSTSEGVSKYIGAMPMQGDDILNHLPEFIGSEDEIQKIFPDSTYSFILESVYKNEYYLNISAEYYSEDTVLVLLHNITDATLSKQKLLQYENELILTHNTSH
jgi:hypothetical protein